jgi:hypothetical protein
MKCSRCSVHFRDNWEPHYMLRNGQGTSWAYRTAECPCCAELTVEVSRTDRHGEPIGDWVPVNPANPVAGGIAHPQCRIFVSNQAVNEKGGERPALGGS